MTAKISRIRTGELKCASHYRLSLSEIYFIVLSPLGIIIFSLFVNAMPMTRSFSAWMLSENGPVELLTFVSLFAAGLIGCKIVWEAMKNKRKIFVIGFYAVFSSGLLFVAMEEVSWGQWIFGFEPPSAIKTINQQGELNLHNFPAFHAPFEYLRVAFGIGGLLGAWFSVQPQTQDIGAPVILCSWFILIAIHAALDVQNYYEPYSDQLIFRVAADIVEVLELLIGLSAFLYMWLNNRMLVYKWNFGA